MATSKKLYVKVAAAINERRLSEDVAVHPVVFAAHADHNRALHRMALDLAKIFAEDNPRFNEDRFMTACGFSE